MTSPNFRGCFQACVYCRNLLTLHTQLCGILPESLVLNKSTYRDLDSPPVMVWRNIYKCFILHVVEHGMYGSWAELPNKLNGPVLASEFFLLWPFIVGTINCMPMVRREDFQKTTKGSTAKVVGGLVKHFNLHVLGYPINVSDKQLLLKMSNKSDKEISKLIHAMRTQRKSELATSRKAVFRYMKGCDKPIPLCHIVVDNVSAFDLF